MSPNLLDPAVQAFIRENSNSDVTRLALQRNPFPEVSWAEVLGQISARQKARDKLPSWYATKNILYPSRTSVEQTSSETAAAYKAALVSGKSLIDLTGGLGVDDFYFAKRIGEVAHCELNAALSAIAAHNFKALGASNIQCVPGDSTETLERLSRQWDWIYIDPSRRNEAKGKVFMLKDCLPDVPGLLDFYFGFTNNILMKTAPLLDISAGLGELHSVKAVHIVAVGNEVKELLWLLEKGFKGTAVIEAINITREGTQAFAAYIEDDSDTAFALPGRYLYEPNSALMKSGSFNYIGNYFKLKKLHRHTHLYSDDVLKEFPGRRFMIREVLPYNKAGMKALEGKKVNVSARNFPLSPEELRKKWKLKDGGDVYAFFVTNVQNEKIVLLCGKI